MGSGEFLDSLDGGVRRRDQGVGEKLDPCELGFTARREGMLEERGQLRGEPEGSLSMEPIEWFFSKAVAGEKEPFLASVQNGKCPHAIESIEHGRPPLPPGVKKHLGIGMVGCEDMSPRLQFGAEFRVIVNLAVENNDRLAVGGRHRLRAAGEVDDG